jgi:hypothetical protein
MMGRTSKKSPEESSAPDVKKKKVPGRAREPLKTPELRKRVELALYDVHVNKVTIRQAARTHGFSYAYLYRRVSGEVDIDSTHGPPPVFSIQEEESMTRWLNEMTARSMGLKPGEFLDVVQGIVKAEKKKTPFTKGRPSYEWYSNFMRRNAHVVPISTEVPLESCRAKLTKAKTDNWYANFGGFLTANKLIAKPKCIWNADEIGFSMGKTTGKVMGPTRDWFNVSEGPGKQRLTVMFCGAADGTMMPPFFVYPQPQPIGYNPLAGALDGSSIAYTTNGWMDPKTFHDFIKHVDKYAGTERPVVLLIDSASSHVNMSSFEYAKDRGIQLYRIPPNATHLMQPLDEGVFGPLKKSWTRLVREHAKDNPANPIGKAKFAEKLKEAFFLFRKPHTVIRSFKSTGIYPVDASVITYEELKPHYDLDSDGLIIGLGRIIEQKAHQIGRAEWQAGKACQ